MAAQTPRKEVGVDLRDELDADVECGSGYISIFGPPGSGKTTMLLQYLTSREHHVRNMKRSFLLEYVTGRALAGDSLRRLAWRLLPQTKRRRTECSHLQFGLLVRQWLDNAVEGSELHFVVDDADEVEEGAEGINQWLSVCVGGSQQPCNSNVVCLWVVSQMPLRLSNCFRFHFVARPDASVVQSWLNTLFATNASPPRAGAGANTPSLTLEEAHNITKGAVEYYMTHLPMRASIVTQDMRQLLQRVHQILPFLAAHAVVGRLNAMHYSTVWGRWRELSSSVATAPSGALVGSRGDPLVAVLRRIGCSAMLWALSAFYCGAVPKSKHALVFGDEKLARRTNSTEVNAASHKAAVLSSLAHVVHLPRLMLVYRSLLNICVNLQDPLEFVPAEIAVQHHQTLVSWGLMVPTTHSTKGYHCHIPVTSAISLSQHLSLNLYDLIPR
ncbi:hypothetical protein, conserved [Trypanosoma brucei gambiense DAL972]|uniref:ORC1/DEAH AAA+ ATPase domain-containing protein n=2 Tax=Trypanosoma brucei TaxID=5691 RepID=D0A3P1_TRYB9|nr:hypothetical protein, conserved [Trypanosoma brucei gambiense DAL972]RHW69805.1 hypothetical protein DPX39_100087000 [Trypanosoma brucei equiperdum]CBH15885.1 hypothetical protein, conserved [Trypanosoma brucei gambiense DAL972]|eukprot:XP_011778149.1 hypothetical protein, conserved [Trypanosoma brucei gambiense DAL972]